MEPAGRIVQLHALEGKSLAIDASIWAIQFMYAPGAGASRTGNSSQILDGFLRRICKLLYFGIRPVFVFDGQTPALKKRALLQRRHLMY